MDDDELNDFLQNAVQFGTSNAILIQENEGQKNFCKASILPVNLDPLNKNNNVKTILENYGIKFLGIVEKDPIFQYVELPSGWKIVSTNHSMWNELLDNKHRIRANIFYKAAFLRYSCPSLR